MRKSVSPSGLSEKPNKQKLNADIIQDQKQKKPLMSNKVGNWLDTISKKNQLSAVGIRSLAMQ